MVARTQPAMMKPNRWCSLSLITATVRARTVATAKMGMDMTWAWTDVHPNCLRIVGVKRAPAYEVVTTPRYIAMLFRSAAY